MYKTALITMLALVTSNASADNCDKSNYEYFGITVHNNTNQMLHLDLGVPTHGEVNTNRYIYIAPHDVNDTSVCSAGWLRGVQTYIRLYDHADHYMADWYVKQPYSGQNTITFHGYHCHAVYYTGKMHYKNSREVWKYTDPKDEPSVFYTHRGNVNVEVTCD